MNAAIAKKVRPDRRPAGRRNEQPAGGRARLFLQRNAYGSVAAALAIGFRESVTIRRDPESRKGSACPSLRGSPSKRTYPPEGKPGISVHLSCGLEDPIPDQAEEVCDQEYRSDANLNCNQIHVFVSSVIASRSLHCSEGTLAAPELLRRVHRIRLVKALLYSRLRSDREVEVNKDQPAGFSLVELRPPS